MKNIFIVPLEDHPFNDHPQLTNIWPEPFTSIMQEAVTEDLEIEKNYPELDIGKIFLIYENEQVIGITGYFVVGESGYREAYDFNTSTIYLRWHGITPEKRGCGISEEVMIQLLTDANIRYPNLQQLIELVPQCDYGRPLEQHFKKLGFVATGEQEKYDWSEYHWQPYVLDTRKFLENNKVNQNIKKESKLWN